MESASDIPSCFTVNGHDPLQAVVTKTLPQLDRENEIERAWLFESVQTHAFCWFIVCSRHIYLFFYIPYLLGVFGAQSRWTAAFIVILGGKTASNVHYLAHQARLL